MRPANVVYGPPITAPYGAPAPGMVPMVYYPAPPQPQQAYMAPAPGAPAPQEKAPVTSQQPPQNYQNLAGFYAPAGSPAAQAPSPGSNEITAAPPRA